MRRLVPLLLFAGLASTAVADSAVGPGTSPETDTTGPFPFRRMSEPVQIAVGPTAQMTQIPASVLTNPMTGQQLTAFHVVNPNRTWVRLKGFYGSDCNAGSTAGVTPTTGWLWPPGYVGIYSTQYPVCVSALAVAEPGYPLPQGSTNSDGTSAYAPLELSYGTGQ